MKKLAIAGIAFLTASVAFADASIQQKVQLHFGGALGGVINVFGRGATHEGLTSDIAIRGDRKMSRTNDRGEIVDLGEEKIYHLDYGRKSYSVTTFDELRKQYEEQQQRSEKREEGRREKNEGPEYEVEFDVKSTGNHEEINGWRTHQEIVTITVHEKGKPIEKSGGWILTSDMWVGPRVAAMHEVSEFERRFMHKLYGQTFDMDMRQMTAMMAVTPAFATAMKSYARNASKLEGTPIRTKLTFDTVTGTEQNAQGSGSLLSRMHRHKEEGPERSTLFESNTELLKASASASSAEVAIPEGFRER